MWWVVDKVGGTLDTLIQKRKKRYAALKFFKKRLKGQCPTIPSGAWTTTKFIPRRTTLTARRKLSTVASSLVHHVATSELRLLNEQVRTL